MLKNDYMYNYLKHGVKKKTFNKFIGNKTLVLFSTYRPYKFPSSHGFLELSRTETLNRAS
jgi:hypothetical protein